MINSNQLRFFSDYSESKCFNGILAIEPELSVKHLLNKETKNRDRGWRFALNKNHPLLSGHYESNNIFEINNLHTLSRVKRKYYIDIFTRNYKNTFTIGSSSYMSGGVHFHIFSLLESNKALAVIDKINYGILIDNFHCSLLFGMIDKETNFFSRNSYNGYGCMTRGINEGASGCARVKDEFLPGIEYRLNNVFDTRLYGYYVGIQILSSFGLKLNSIGITDNIYNIIEKGSTECFNEAKKKTTESVMGTVNIKNCKPLFNIKNDLKYKVMLDNLDIILFTLKINKLFNARLKLIKYIEEILGVTLGNKSYCLSTMKKIPNDSKGHIVSLNGMDIFQLNETVRCYRSYNVLSDFGIKKVKLI